ncbi:MAG: site-2 protease family protein [Paracoccaceae bacterium]
MLELVLSLILCAGTFVIISGGLTSPTGQGIAGYDPQATGLGLLAILAAAYFWGPLFGMALIVSVMIHEYGHVAAYRICGHADARFRLIPLIGGAAISNQHPASEEKAFFIALMGPGICLAPMVLAFALSEFADAASYPQVAKSLWVFGSVTGALNFFNLLPLWPLDGAHCLRVVINTFWPRASRQLTYAMAGSMVVAALWMQSILLLLIALGSTRGLLAAENLQNVRQRMTPAGGSLALLAYGFTAAAHFRGGEAIIKSFLSH